MGFAVALFVLAERRSEWFRKHLRGVVPHSPRALLPSAACFLLGVVLSVAIFALLGLEPVPANLFGFVAKGARLGIAFPIPHIL